MIRLLFLLVCLFLGNFNLASANECKVDSNISALKKVNVDLPFRNILERSLSVYSPIPTGNASIGDSLLIFDEDKRIGFQRTDESFFKEDSIGKDLDMHLNGYCKNPVIELEKSGFKVFIANYEKTFKNKDHVIAFIVSEDNKYYYHISFINFSINEVVEMLLK